MKCATCGTAEYDEREPMYGHAQIRCGCGLRPTPRISPDSLPKKSQRLVNGGNGFMKGGIFYGTCRAASCGASFESAHPKQTCGAPACTRWAKTRTERMIPRICGCQAAYTTRYANPSIYCGAKCRRKAKNERDAAGKKAKLLAQRTQRLADTPALPLDQRPTAPPPTLTLRRLQPVPTAQPPAGATVLVDALGAQVWIMLPPDQQSPRP